MRLENKVVVVTGASSGMGHAIATLFVNEGAKVVAVARRKERLDALAESLKNAPGTILPFVGDISDPAQNDAMIDFAVEKFGRLDVLVNNAGIMDDMSPVGDLTDEMLERLMKVNTYGPIYAMRKAVKTFLKQESAGNIINVTSVGADHNTAGAAYAASKAAVWAVSRNTTFQYRDKGIRCNCIAPGTILTSMTDVLSEKVLDGLIKSAVFPKRLGKPEEFASIACEILRNMYINGTTIYLDGAMRM
jgi:NAD(P)-dependent dehydrogenase (short-subunit alcohol dehydrogenase family)